jgi:MFS family permease
MQITSILRKRHLWPLFGLLAVQLLTGMMLMPANSFISIFLNESLSYSIGQVGRVIALGQAVGMAASLLGGGVSDRWGHKRVLILGVGLITLSNALFLLRAPWMVVSLWCMAGVGLAFSVLSSQGYLTMVAGAGVLGVASALYNWGYTIGGVIGNPLAAAALGRDRFWALGLMLMGLGVMSMAVLAVLPNLRLDEKEQEEKPGMFGYDALLQPRLIILGLLRFLPTTFYGLMALVPLLIKQQGGGNAIVAAYATVSLLLASLAQLVAGRSADRWSVRGPTTVAFSVILTAIAGIILTANSVWGLYAFGVLGVSAAWALSTLLPGLVTTAAEPEIRGRVFGALHMLWTLAMMLGALLGGELLDIDLRLPFLIVGLLNIFALALTFPFFQMGRTAPDV